MSNIKKNNKLESNDISYVPAQKKELFRIRTNSNSKDHISLEKEAYNYS